MAKNEQNLSDLRHSLAHLLAAAVMELWPTTKRTIGPAIDNGFYFDFDFEQPISQEDLPNIEAKMREILPSWTHVERHELTPEEAKSEYPNNNFKHELIDELVKKGEKHLSFYKSGKYWDLCRGGHVDDLSKIDPQSFMLQKVAGAYWRGDSNNKMLTRIYGLAFATKKELKQHVAMLEEVKKRNHRKLGRELDLFVFSDLVGQGLPLFTPRGTILRRKLDDFVQEMRDEYDYQEVNVPHITKKEAYIASGHWKKFEHELFKIKTREGHEFAMKPMNCPHHTQIYASRARSYKELPVRYRETTTCYRDEQTGELSGLARVRSFAQDDAHVFCRVPQIEAEVAKIWDIVERFYGVFDFDLRIRFSTHDPSDAGSYMGDSKQWQTTEAQLKNIVKSKVGDDFVAGVGEAAFYGPKIDFLAKDAIGREHQVATIQVDFNQPEGFDLTCTNEQGEQERIVMVHAAIMGSIERFLSVYIEHCAGKFPVWLAPEQVRVITLNQEDATVAFAHDIHNQAKALGLRLTVDQANESVSKKIRSAEVMKIPYTLVVGPKEVQTGLLSPRIRKDMVVNEKHEARDVQEFLKTVANESKTRVNKTSF